MACQRNRILELKEYLSSLGIEINIGKNRARGHKGFFLSRFDNFRIDISNNLNEEEVISVLMHEFAHFIHYSYDKNLKSLDFIFGELNNEIKEELIKVTVNDVPKEYAQNLFSKKKYLEREMNDLAARMKEYNPKFKLSEKDFFTELRLPLPFNYLLKYDKVKYYDKVYSADGLDNEFSIGEKEKLYIKIKMLQRAIKRINSKISRLNRYYNNPSELFARLISLYYTNPELTYKLAPQACSYIRKTDNIYLKKINDIMSDKQIKM